MRRYVLLCAVVAALPAFASEAAEWGPAVNGLRISISIVPAEGRAGDIQLALQNTGSEEFAVRIGSTKRIDGTGCKVFGPVKVFFKNGEGAVRVVRLSSTAGSGPAPRACTVVLHPGGERSFREPLSIFSNIPAYGFPDLSQRGELWVEFEPRADSVGAGCGGPPCWLGKVVSNTLVLPQALK